MKYLIRIRFIWLFSFSFPHQIVFTLILISYCKTIWFAVSITTILIIMPNCFFLNTFFKKHFKKIKSKWKLMPLIIKLLLTNSMFLLTNRNHILFKINYWKRKHRKRSHFLRLRLNSQLFIQRMICYSVAQL